MARVDLRYGFEYFALYFVVIALGAIWGDMKHPVFEFDRLRVCLVMAQAIAHRAIE